MDTSLETRCLSETDFAVPVEDRWFEDYVTGSSYEWGYVSFTEEAIIDFARVYDPQTMHVDPVAARATPFGGLIASGWHTAAAGSRVFVDHFVTRVASMASPGMDELRWALPVRPGDTLSVRAEITSTRVTTSDPSRGLVHTTIEMLNQDRRIVASMKAMNFFRLRTPAT
jgi:acyl dehydratase